MSDTSATAELENAFTAWKDGLNTGDLDAFWQAFDERAEILDEDFPWRMSKEDFVDHIDYTVKLIGIDHVGIASDFDGGGGVIGWNDASETFNVTLELVRRGYTEQQIEKLWGGNLLRVMDAVQRIAGELQKN